MENDEEYNALCPEATQGVAEINFSWCENDAQKLMGTRTVSGMMSLTTTHLEMAINSVNRAARLQIWLEDLLQGAVTFESKRTEEAPDVPSLYRGNVEVEALPYEAAMRRVKQYWVEWLDNDLDSIGRLTPRQASMDATGRLRLEAIMEDLTTTNIINQNDLLAADVPMLKHVLGL